MNPFVASTTIQTLADTGSNVFNSLIVAWIQLFQNSTLVILAVTFGVVGTVLVWIRRKLF